MVAVVLVRVLVRGFPRAVLFMACYETGVPVLSAGRQV